MVLLENHWVTVVLAQFINYRLPLLLINLYVFGYDDKRLLLPISQNERRILFFTLLYGITFYHHHIRHRHMLARESTCENRKSVRYVV